MLVSATMELVAHDMHAYGMHAYEMYAYEMYAYEMYAYEMYAYEMYATRCTPRCTPERCMPARDACPPEMHAYERCMRTASGTRKMLIPERLWHQKNVDTANALAPEKC
jgi:hypothetical protein